MEVNITGRLINSDRIASDLISFLKDSVSRFGLEESELYYDFPVLKDNEGVVVRSRIMLVSKKHGVIVIEICDARSREKAALREELIDANGKLDRTYSLLLSRLMRSSSLRRSRGELRFRLEGLLFAPFVNKDDQTLDFEVLNYDSLGKYLEETQTDAMPDPLYSDIVATLEGSRAITRNKNRDVSNLNENSKGAIANRIESEIDRFDQGQKHGAITVLDGLQRIRGLAGSGKTVVLAMKAAQMHLREPEANILYTFYTRSLYQHIKRLITQIGRAHV